MDKKEWMPIKTVPNKTFFGQNVKQFLIGKYTTFGWKSVISDSFTHDLTIPGYGIATHWHPIVDPPGHINSNNFLTDEDVWFDYLRRKYVQCSDKRQKEMNLQYMTAETHDLAREIVNYIEHLINLE